jgi:hypothetical protein
VSDDKKPKLAPAFEAFKIRRDFIACPDIIRTDTSRPRGGEGVVE